MKNQPDQKPQRVMCYVDGFNLYFGLRESKLRNVLWLDIHKLASRLILPHQRIAGAKYFTARLKGPSPTDSPGYAQAKKAKQARQSAYLDALNTVDGIKIIYGQYLEDKVYCHKCGASWMDAEEKMTDVNIATHMIVDAFANKYDTALLISGDSDLVPPVKAVLECFPHKKVVVAFPPSRNSVSLKKVASAQFMLSKGQLKKSQLPSIINPGDKAEVRRPEKWS